MTTNGANRRFRVLRCVGQGSFGKVYQAEMLTDAGLVRPVALKVYVHTPGAPDEGLARFRDEARLMARLSHRCLVPVVDLLHLPPGWTIVMEWVDGVDAAALMDDRSVPARVALTIVAEVASALAAAWGATNEDGSPLRLLHRDIKPSNIRVSLHGDVRLLDLGAARGDLQSREAKTTRWRLGTIPYMAPERMDEGVEDPSCDVFSLGLVALDLMRGSRRQNILPREPHTARHLEALRQDLVDWGQLSEEAAGRVIVLLRGMTDPEGERRPTAAEVAVLAAALADELPGPRPAAWLAQEARTLAASAGASAVEDPWTGQIITEALPTTVPLTPTPAPLDDAATMPSQLGPTEPVELPPAPEPPVVPPEARGSRAAVAAGAGLLLAAAAIIAAWTGGGPAPVAEVVAEAPAAALAPIEAPAAPVEATPTSSSATSALPPPSPERRPATPQGRPAPQPAAPAPQPAAPAPAASPTLKPAQTEPPRTEPPRSEAPPRQATVTQVSIEAGRTLKARRDGRVVPLPGELTAGTWELLDDRGTRRGQVQVKDGEQLTITCSERTSICRR